MASGQGGNEADTPNQQSLPAYSDRGSIISWIESTATAGAADFEQVDLSEAEEPGRTLTPMPRRTIVLSPTEMQKGCARVVSSAHASIMPTFCYRLLKTGLVVVSDGHPFACACARNGHLLGQKDSKYIPPVPAYNRLPPEIWLLDDRQKYLEIVMVSCTKPCYPFDKFGVMSYNPFQYAERRDFMTQTPLALEPVLLIGAAFDMLHRGDMQLSVLTANVAYILRLVGEIYDSSLPPKHTALEMQLVFHALGCIPSVFWCTGNTREWHAHMKDLKQYLETTGFLEIADPHTLAKVRMSDIEGAIIAGAAPSLPYRRKLPLLPCVLPVEDVQLILAILRPPLQSCSVPVDAVDTILASCIFVTTMRTSQEGGISEKFDPENLVEDYHLLQRDLLTLPAPFTPDLHEHVTMKASTALEEALRITTLMCLRAADLQGPWSRVSYNALLKMLVNRLRAILSWLYESQDDCAFIDPRLLNSFEDGFPVTSARPLLIWMSMIGYELSIYLGIYHDGWSDHHPENCVYTKLLGALGLNGESDIEICKNEDFVIFDIFNLNWATGKKWHGRGILQWMIG